MLFSHTVTIHASMFQRELALIYTTNVIVANKTMIFVKTILHTIIFRLKKSDRRHRWILKV